MNKKEQYIVNNKHVEQEHSYTEYDNYKFSELKCIERCVLPCVNVYLEMNTV